MSVDIAFLGNLFVACLVGAVGFQVRQVLRRLDQLESVIGRYNSRLVRIETILKLDERRSE